MTNQQFWNQTFPTNLRRDLRVAGVTIREFARAGGFTLKQTREFCARRQDLLVNIEGFGLIISRIKLA